MPGLPLICDPSHIAGRREIVGEIAQQAMDMGFYGLMVEVHPNPQNALSDARQQLDPEAFANLIATLRLRKNKASDSSADLAALREEIDSIDDALLDILSRRMAVSDAIGRLKQTDGMPVVQPERYRNLIDRRCRQAEAAGLSPVFMQAVLAAIHEESVRRQLAIVNARP